MISRAGRGVKTQRDGRSATARYREPPIEILRGKGSPTVTTLAKLAKALDVEVRELFTFPERDSRDRAIDLLASRFPVTLYKEQWTKLLDRADDIRAFIRSNEASLKTKS